MDARNGNTKIIIASTDVGNACFCTFQKDRSTTKGTKQKDNVIRKCMFLY